MVKPKISQIAQVYKNYIRRLKLSSLIGRYAIILVATFITTILLRGLEITSFPALFSFALILLLVNIFIAPLINLLFLRISVMTFGLSTLIVNAIILLLIAQLEHGITITGGIWDAIWVTFWYTIVISIITTITSVQLVDYAEIMYLRDLMKGSTNKDDSEGLFFLEIDGLSLEVLEDAIENGYVPTLKKWLESTHKVIGWECDLSSQTSASQAGILHGDNSYIPAFRWLNRETQEVMTSNNHANAVEIQKKISNDKGILVDEGISFNNMFHGDSPQTSLNISNLGSYNERKETLKLFMMYPSSFMNSLVFTVTDTLIEIKDGMLQQFMNVQPRIPRTLGYILLRPITTVMLRDLSIFTVVDAMLGSVTTLYTTFVGYDEVAHHAGIRDISAMNVLRKLDDQFAKLEYMAGYTKGKDKLVILSDHGQSQGWTFKQRFGYSLDDFIQKIVENTEKIDLGLLEEEHSADLKHTKDIVTKKKRGDKRLPPGQVISMASGNQGLIFLTGHKERQTKEQIDKRYPSLIKDLAEHKGIHFAFVDSKDGPVAMNQDGKHYILSGEIDGKDPLAIYESETVVQHLTKYNESPNVPDIMVMSMYDPETKEVAAFEELVGNHGGLGGPQSHPFIMYPKELSDPEGDMIGADKVYHLIKKWLEEERERLENK